MSPVLTGVEEVVCAHCEHRMLYHGDRAITACDGGWQATGHQRIAMSGGRAVCSCPGWKAGEVMRLTDFTD